MKYLRLWMGLALFIIFLSGCGADLKMTTQLEPDGSGIRRFIIEVPDDQMKEVIGGEPALTKVLTDKMPEGAKLDKKTEKGNTVYTYEMDFKTIEELNAKSEKWLGGPANITLKKEGTPFSKTYIFNDTTPLNDYFKWASKAVIEQGIIKQDHYDHLIRSNRAEIQMPADKQGAVTPVFGNQPIRSEKHFPVESVAVETDIRSEQNLTRTIKLTVLSDVEKQINQEKQDLIQEYIKSISKDSEVGVSESDHTKQFLITLKADSAEKLDGLSKPFLENEDLILETAHESMFFPVIHFNDRADLSKFLGNRVQVTQGYTYRLLFNGKLVTPDGKSEVLENNIPVEHAKTITQKQPYFDIAVYVKRTTLTFYIVVGAAFLIGIFLLASLVLFIRKYPDKIKKLVATSNAAVAFQVVPAPEKPKAGTEIYCYECGASFEPNDRYCHHCGEKKQSIERGA